MRRATKTVEMLGTAKVPQNRQIQAEYDGERQVSPSIGCPAFRSLMNCWITPTLLSVPRSPIDLNYSIIRLRFISSPKLCGT